MEEVKGLMALEQTDMYEQEEDTQHGRYLTFAVGEEIYGIGIGMVTEIVGLQPITAMPEMPDYIKGIINLRGKIIPVMDMRRRFHKEPMAYNDRTCIIVLDMQDVSIGLIVDQVAEVTSIADENIATPPDYRAGIENRYLQGIGKAGNAVILLLDTQKLLRDEELQDLQKMN